MHELCELTLDREQRICLKFYKILMSSSQRQFDRFRLILHSISLKQFHNQTCVSSKYIPNFGHNVSVRII